MEIKFKEDVLVELYETGKTKDGKYKKLCKNKKLVDGYIRAVETMYDVESTEELKQYSFLHYEKLKYQQGGINKLRQVGERNDRTSDIHRDR